MKLRIKNDDILVLILLIVCVFFVGGLLGYILKLALEG
jgi:hypothetical protein